MNKFAYPEFKSNLKELQKSIGDVATILDEMKRTQLEDRIERKITNTYIQRELDTIKSHLKELSNEVRGDKVEHLRSVK